MFGAGMCLLNRLNHNGLKPRQPHVGWGAEPVARDAEAAAELARRESAWVFYHQALNHRDSAVRSFVRKGLLKGRVSEPPNWRCPGCELAKAQNAAFHQKDREVPRDKASLRPYAEVVTDISGPYKVNDRNGFEWLVGFTDVATNFKWVHPMQRKSQAVEGLELYSKHIDATARFAEAHLGYDPGVVKFGTLYQDRDGAYSTTFGSHRSRFDEKSGEVCATRQFATPGTPQSGTVVQERVWKSMREAADASMVTSGMLPEYKVDAMIFAIDVSNILDSEGNILGNGEPPLQTLGIDGHLERIVPFGNPCVVKFKSVEKGVLTTQTGRIIGFGKDTPGYRVLLDRSSGADANSPAQIVTSVHVTPRRNGKAWGPSDDGSFKELPPRQPDVAPVDYVPLPTREELLALEEAEADTPEVTRIPVVQTIGAAPGHGGSRAALLPRPETAQRASPAGKKRAVMTMVSAKAKAKDAQSQGLSFVFDQVNPKKPGSLCHKRYERYKVAKTFAELDVFRRELCDHARTWTTGDLHNDVAHGFVVFAYPQDAAVLPLPSPPAAAAPATPAVAATHVPPDVPEDSGSDGSLGGGGDGESESGSSIGEDDDGHDPGTRGTRGPRVHPMRLRQLVPGKSGAVVVEAPLTIDERGVMEALRGWHGPDAVHSRRDSSGLGDLPLRVVRAAVATVTGGAALRDVVQPGPLPRKIFDIRDNSKLALVPRVLPRDMRKLRQEPDWATGILPAIKKEYTGLIELGVFNEVPRQDWMNVIPTHRLDSIKPEKYKSRWVAQGNRTIGGGVHYDATATSMASQVPVKLVTAFAAGDGYELFGFDFEQAFLRAKVENPNLYVMLPELPPEMQGGEWGSGRGSNMVGHVQKSLYGLCDSPRNWQRHLLKSLTTEVGATILASDRNCFKFTWRGMTMIGAVHVDDVLYAGAQAIRDEFLRRIKLQHAVTGGDEPVRKFCGYQFVHDRQRQTIHMHQADFARALLTRFDMLKVRPVDTPMIVGAPPLGPWEGDEVSERTKLDYMVLVGSVTWLTRTWPSLALAALSLSQFVNRPGPDHLAAGRRVMAYMCGNTERGLTFHGSDTVLDQGYPHRHLITASTDSGFSHKGEKAVSGSSILMNGAVILHVARRQTTVSNQSTEAEVKAAALTAELLQGVVQIWSEFAGVRHPSVRTMIDNKGAKTQCESGTDSVASAPYLRSKRFVESKVYSGLMWLDLVPGPVNPSDMATKQVRSTSEFAMKDNILSGREPHLYESAEVVAMLAAGRQS